MNKRRADSRTDSSTMLVYSLVLLLLSGCTSAEKLEYPPEALRDAIRRGEVVQPGDRVAITSVGGGEQVLVISEIDDDTIRSADAEVPIEEVIALEKRKFSPVRTGLAGLAASTAAIVVVAASVFLRTIGVL